MACRVIVVTSCVTGRGRPEREQTSALQRALVNHSSLARRRAASVQCSSNNPSYEDHSDWPCRRTILLSSGQFPEASRPQCLIFTKPCGMLEKSA